jgi:hypothetical protein
MLYTSEISVVVGGCVILTASGDTERKQLHLPRLARRGLAVLVAIRLECLSNAFQVQTGSKCQGMKQSEIEQVLHRGEIFLYLLLELIAL